MLRIKQLLAMSFVIVLGVAACGDDDGSSDGDADNTEAQEDPGSDLTGEPIKVAMIGSDVNIEDSVNGLEIAADAINDAGGIQGRPVEFDVCEDNNDANRAAECARDAIADESVLAFVGNSTSYGDSINPLAEQAGMSIISGSLFTTGDFSAANFFPTQGGSITSIVGQSIVCVDLLEAETLALPYLDVPTGAQLPPLIQSTVTGPRDLSDPIAVPVPLTAADLGSQVAAVGDADCAAIALTTDLASRFINTARQQGLELPFGVPAAVYTPSIIDEQLGGDVEGIYPVSSYDLESEGYEDFLSEVEKYAPDLLGVVESQSVQAWLGLHMLADIANQLDGELTREAITQAFAQTSAYDTGGLTIMPLNYTEPATALGGSLQNLFPSVTGAWAYEYVDGEYQRLNDGESLDLFGAASG